MLKAAAGGGGKGMRLVENPKDFDSSLATAQREAMSAFGDNRVYIEKAVSRPHHIEIQVFADTHGDAIWLGERECSVQRRHQKVIEETPSAIVTPELRAEMGRVAVNAAKAVGYVGAGTCEFLAEGPGVRNDCGFESGSEVPRYYDPMIGKLACWAPTRAQAIARLRRALGETVVKGITTNVAYLKRVLDLDEFRAGDYDTGLLAHAADRLKASSPVDDRDLALAAAAIWQLEQDERTALSAAPAAASAESLWSRAGRLSALRRSR